MRHIAAPEEDTWGALVRRNRLRLQRTQDELAKALGVALKTVSRWENRNARPESYETAVAAIRILGLDREEGLRLAGFGPGQPGAPEPDPYAYIREMGLDPANVVVQRIINIPGISDEMRDMLLRRERELQLRYERQRLEDLDWWQDGGGFREAG